MCVRVCGTCDRFSSLLTHNHDAVSEFARQPAHTFLIHHTIVNCETMSFIILNAYHGVGKMTVAHQLV